MNIKTILSFVPTQPIFTILLLLSLGPISIYMNARLICYINISVIRAYNVYKKYVIICDIKDNLLTITEPINMLLVILENL